MSRPNLFVLLMVAISMTVSVLAAEAPKKSQDSKKPVDLGEIEVEGDVRKPMIDWLESGRYLKDNLVRMAKDESEFRDNQLMEGTKVDTKAGAEFKKRQGDLNSFEDQLLGDKP